MEIRPLGRTGVQVSSLCLGCMMFGRRTEPEESYAIIDRALDAGINFLDTANVYALGKSEEITGEALKRNGQRHNVVLATKVHGAMDAEDPNARGNSRRHIIEQCEASLRRLQTDYIDLYQLHRPQADIPIDETLRALDDLVRDGKVRYIGTSTFAAWEIVESLWVSKEFNLNRIVCEQPPYNLLDRRAERELLPMAQTFGIGVIPWGPLGGGLLTGRYQRGQALPEDGRYAMNPQQQRRLTEGVYDIVEGLTPIANEKGCTLSQLALAWCEQQPGITSPIIGPRTMEQLEDNLGAADVVITDEDRERIDAVIAPGRTVTPYYEVTGGLMSTTSELSAYPSRPGGLMSIGLAVPADPVVGQPRSVPPTRALRHTRAAPRFLHLLRHSCAGRNHDPPNLAESQCPDVHRILVTESLGPAVVGASNELECFVVPACAGMTEELVVNPPTDTAAGGDRVAGDRNRFWRRQERHDVGDVVGVDDCPH